MEELGGLDLPVDGIDFFLSFSSCTTLISGLGLIENDFLFKVFNHLTHSIPHSLLS